MTGYHFLPLFLWVGGWRGGGDSAFLENGWKKLPEELQGPWAIKRDYRALALQRQNTEISKQIFPEKEYPGLSPNFHIHVSVIDLYIPTIGLPILLEEICRPILGLYI